jgi:hypothetical protein
MHENHGFETSLTNFMGLPYTEKEVPYIRRRDTLTHVTTTRAEACHLLATLPIMKRPRYGCEVIRVSFANYCALSTTKVSCQTNGGSRQSLCHPMHHPLWTSDRRDALTHFHCLQNHFPVVCRLN